MDASNVDFDYDESAFFYLDVLLKYYWNSTGLHTFTFIENFEMWFMQSYLLSSTDF